jgi:hypothetical protein
MPKTVVPQIGAELRNATAGMPRQDERTHGDAQARNLIARDVGAFRSHGIRAMKARGRTPGEAVRLTKTLMVRVRGDGEDFNIPLQTIADAQAFLRRVPDRYRQQDPWQKLEGELDKAEKTRQTGDATLRLQHVLSMNGLLGKD